MIEDIETTMKIVVIGNGTVKHNKEINILGRKNKHGPKIRKKYFYG